MKLLDKKRIKVKKGEYLAVNERNMLAKVMYFYFTPSFRSDRSQPEALTLSSFLLSSHRGLGYTCV